ncbi:MAG: TaqI-like C-terminal specificity domain-containing protein [Bacteroidota bacterium]|nr:TaqI-like C-terminal specificity domain-containing protein [Bacteroidota bacterium]
MPDGRSGKDAHPSNSIPQTPLNPNAYTLIPKVTPEQVAKMAFADIACGSGSFLLEVYSQLLDYHTRYYNEFPEKAKKGDFETREGKIVLSHKKRQDILVNNIYGVDIDFQATEVTQLSLYLKLMEDVTMNEAYQFSLLKERMLPDLRRNIVCGNSLIGRDILDGKLFDDETERTLKPMNFEDVFPHIFSPLERGRRGVSDCGFDAVVGNPPYLNNKELPEYQKKYFVSKYKTAVDQFDLYTLFIENGLNLLTADGYFSYIIPDAIIDRSSATSLRKFIYENSKIISLLQINKVFEEAKVGSIILVLQKKKNAKEKFNYFKCANPKEFFSNKIQTKAITQSNIQNFRNYSYLFVDDNEWAVIQKIFNDKISLESISFMGRGEELGKSSNLAKNFKGKNNIGLLYGEDIQRYHLKEPERFISKNDIRKQERLYDVKIVVRQVGEEINASFDENNYVTIQSVYTIIPNDEYGHKYILGILNSKMIDFIYKKLYKSKELFPRILLESLKELPIPQINFQNKTEKAAHEKIVQLVEQMLAAKAKHAAATTESEKNRLDIQIEALDRQIDNAVYELYGLTEEERRIVEGDPRLSV